MLKFTSYTTCFLLLLTASLAFAAPLEKEIADNLTKVAEFRFIREEAAKLGVKVYLFGGTAAGYAHYVKWDAQRRSGQKRFQENRFDYDYTNIFRSTQDADLVVDGPPEAAKKLEAALRQKYPYLQGSKTAWEVRLLRQSMDNKEALLGNPDFSNQHTDSNSTGMIDLTDGSVHDLRDWGSKTPNFLKDVAEGKLHYYFSEKHGDTKRFRDGMNPPIFSVIRFLTKAFQYELEIRPEDRAAIERIIADFDPKRDLTTSYARNWIEKNGKKLLQHAVNLEYAVKTLDALHLRGKLRDLTPLTDVDSLGWWMNREPLRTAPLGVTGKTAAELDIKIVAHETNSFLAYESITRAHTGDPNVLVSRESIAGESAAHGEGFYTAMGRRGARGTGLTIRFEVDPNAREGEDFTKAGDFVIFHNKAALRVIPESLQLGPADYFRMLARGETVLDDTDKGILEKLKRRIDARLHHATEKEWKTIFRLADAELRKKTLNRVFWSEFLTLGPVDKKKFVLALVEKHSEHILWFNEMLEQEPWVTLRKSDPEFRKRYDAVRTTAFLAEAERQLAKETEYDGGFWPVLFQEKFSLKHRGLLDRLVETHPRALKQILLEILATSRWSFYLAEPAFRQKMIPGLIARLGGAQVPHWEVIGDMELALSVADPKRDGELFTALTKQLGNPSFLYMQEHGNESYMKSPFVDALFENGVDGLTSEYAKVWSEILYRRAHHRVYYAHDYDPKSWNYRQPKRPAADEVALAKRLLVTFEDADRHLLDRYKTDYVRFLIHNDDTLTLTKRAFERDPVALVKLHVELLASHTQTTVPPDTTAGAVKNLRWMLGAESLEKHPELLSYLFSNEAFRSCGTGATGLDEAMKSIYAAVPATPKIVDALEKTLESALGEHGPSQNWLDHWIFSGTVERLLTQPAWWASPKAARLMELAREGALHKTPWIFRDFQAPSCADLLRKL